MRGGQAQPFQGQTPRLALDSYAFGQNLGIWLLVAEETGKCSFQSTFSLVANVPRGKFRESYLMEEREDKLFEDTLEIYTKVR